MYLKNVLNIKIKESFLLAEVDESHEIERSLSMVKSRSFVCAYIVVKFKKMAAKQNSILKEAQTTSDDIPLTSLEESLLSLEKLDRASPELWPEQIPGVSEFAPLQNPDQSPPSWNKGLTKEDYNYMRQLELLSKSSLIMEVKKLHDLAYQLGLEEAKEMTRGKYLNIFTSRRQR